MSRCNSCGEHYDDSGLMCPPCTDAYDRMTQRRVDEKFGKGEANTGSALDTQVGGSHYKDMPVQPIELMRIVLTPQEYIGYLKGNIIKYSMRAGHKPNTDDSAKAAHYRQFLREIRPEVEGERNG